MVDKAKVEKIFRDMLGIKDTQNEKNSQESLAWWTILLSRPAEIGNSAENILHVQIIVGAKARILI